MSWQSKAECAQKTDLFYPEEELSADEQDEQYEEAKSICETCPFKAQCLDLGIKEKFGVWGGTTPKERVQLRKLARKPKKS